MVGSSAPEMAGGGVKRKPAAAELDYPLTAARLRQAGLSDEDVSMQDAGESGEEGSGEVPEAGEAENTIEEPDDDAGFPSDCGSSAKQWARS